MLAGCDRDPPIVTTGLDPATAKQLLERLDRLIAAMQSAHVPISIAPAPGAPALMSVSSPASEHVAIRVAADDLARLEALERTVAQLLAGGGAIARGAGVGTFSPVPSRATATLESLRQQMAGEDEPRRQEARREFFRMSEDQLVHRLGMPDDVDLLPNDQWVWTYRIGDGELRFVFHRGLVAQVW